MAPSAPGSNGRRNSTRGSTRNTTTVKKEINNSTSSLKLDLHSNPETSDSDDRRSESLLPVRTRGRGRGRGRPPRRAALVASSRSSKLAQPVIESELESDQESNDDEAEEDQGEDSASQKGKGGEEDNEGTLEESGEAKITKDGELLGGREFKCRSFKLPDRGNRVYMLSMDPARVLGFRDSYLFFLKNPQLVRVITTVDERQWMIENGILMANFKSKAIAVVTARSIFKLFGSKIIKGGRARVDDYFENSVEDGEDSDASSLTGSGNTAPGSTTGGHTEEGTPVATSMKRKYRATAQEERTTHVTDLNWQYESAMAVRTLNSQLRDLRKENSKFLDPHTNTEHGPSFLQPSRCEVREVSKRAKLLGSSKGFVSIPSSIGPKTDETVRVEVRAAAPTPPYINDPSIWAVIPQEIQKSLQAAEQMRNEQAPEDDEDLTRYPISILSGQYQAAYPIHQARFKQPYRAVLPKNMSQHAQYIHHLWSQQPRQDVPLFEKVSFPGASDSSVSTLALTSNMTPFQGNPPLQHQLTGHSNNINNPQHSAPPLIRQGPVTSTPAFQPVQQNMSSSSSNSRR